MPRSSQVSTTVRQRGLVKYRDHMLGCGLLEVLERFCDLLISAELTCSSQDSSPSLISDSRARSIWMCSGRGCELALQACNPPTRL